MQTKHGVALALVLGLMLSGLANAEEEEGKLELTEQQIEAAGIQLAQAQPRPISTVLSLPGEAYLTEISEVADVEAIHIAREFARKQLAEALFEGLWLRYQANRELSKRRAQAVADALAGRRASVPVDLIGTAFQKKVWDALMKIPPGETRSYAEEQYKAINDTRNAADPAHLLSNRQEEQSRRLEEIMIMESPTGLFTATEIASLKDNLTVPDET